MPDRCSSCRFWKEMTGAPPITQGDCRRHAPQAANQAILFGAEAIIAVADILARHHDVEWPKDIQGEATETTNVTMFPRTYADDWCGEHQPDA